MRNIRLTIQYDGTNYFGWQRQPGTSRTIQSTVEKALTKILGEAVHLTAAGRTDSGVHAAYQVANFKTNNAMPLRKIQYGLNSLLPDDIRVLSVHLPAPDFNSRYHAREKTYQYTILNRPFTDVFCRHYVYHYGIAKLDVSRMRSAARLLVGEHDFTSFRAGAQNTVSPVLVLLKTLNHTHRPLHCNPDNWQWLLYKMVRGIAGTLIEIGRGKLPVKCIRGILKSRNRASAGPTAPACGLCLIRVRY